MSTYEYEVARVYDDTSLKNILNDFSKGGWRAIKIFRMRGPGQIGFTVVFERAWLPQSGS